MAILSMTDRWRKNAVGPVFNNRKKRRGVEGRKRVFVAKGKCVWTHVFAVADQFESHPSFSLLIPCPPVFSAVWGEIFKRMGGKEKEKGEPMMESDELSRGESLKRKEKKLSILLMDKVETGEGIWISSVSPSVVWSTHYALKCCALQLKKMMKGKQSRPFQEPFRDKVSLRYTWTGRTDGRGIHFLLCAHNSMCNGNAENFISLMMMSWKKRERDLMRVRPPVESWPGEWRCRLLIYERAVAKNFFPPDTVVSSDPKRFPSFLNVGRLVIIACCSGAVTA